MTVTQKITQRPHMLKSLTEERFMEPTERIESNPEIMRGKPVFRGTRIPVDRILRKLGEGATREELLDGYPRLQPEDIQAALLYAARILAHEETIHPSGQEAEGRAMVAVVTTDQVGPRSAFLVDRHPEIDRGGDLDPVDHPIAIFVDVDRATGGR